MLKQQQKVQEYCMSGVTRCAHAVKRSPQPRRQAAGLHVAQISPAAAFPLMPQHRPCLGIATPVSARCDLSCRVCRSPTVVIGYLMKLRDWRLAESYKWVKDKRPNIKISEGWD